jgi:hypothetical protein
VKKYFLFLYLIFFASSLCSKAGEAIHRRAIVIGIDLYNPNSIGRRLTNLDGCNNDAITFREVLLSRFDFRDEEIKLLSNQEASREVILNGFKNLLESSAKGDVAVIYYAGHGSQVKNSASTEADKKDETIIPADSYLGAKDIRDKELARIFNSFVEKGVVLTVIFDCCHSGSIGRGIPLGLQPKMRYISPDDSYDANDPSSVVPPEENGVLIMSASQDFERAQEQEDSDGNPHGAFTLALLQTLKSLPSISAASDIFNSVRAILKYNGNAQEPVLAATESRKKQSLFGIEKTLLTGKTLLAVINTEGSEITLQGGIAIGVYPGSDLERKDSNGSIFLIRVTANQDLNKCSGNLLSGNLEGVKPGDLFELKTWSVPDNAILKVYVPNSPLDYNQLYEILLLQKKVISKNDYVIIEAPFKDKPAFAVFYNMNKWFITTPEGKLVNLGSSLQEEKINQIIPNGSAVYFSIPPSRGIYDALVGKLKNESSIVTVKSSLKANYILSGRWKNDLLSYGFVLPQISANDSVFNITLPSETNFISVKNSKNDIVLCVDSLYEQVLRLSKIKAWLTLSGPPDDGSFPFSLHLQNTVTKQIIHSGEKVVNGDILKLLLETDTANLAEWDGSKRYTYVFSIDSKGEMQLIYPLSGSVENRMPLLSSSGVPLNQMKLGGVLLRVSEPFGIDTYILLTTNEPIPDPGIFNQKGVKTRGEDSSGIMKLLNIGSGTRGEPIPISSWGIQKLVLKSKEN